MSKTQFLLYSYNVKILLQKKFDLSLVVVGASIASAMNASFPDGEHPCRAYLHLDTHIQQVTRVRFPEVELFFLQACGFLAVAPCLARGAWPMIGARRRAPHRGLGRSPRKFLQNPLPTRLSHPTFGVSDPQNIKFLTSGCARRRPDVLKAHAYIHHSSCPVSCCSQPSSPRPSRKRPTRRRVAARARVIGTALSVGAAPPRPLASAMSCVSRVTRRFERYAVHTIAAPCTRSRPLRHCTTPNHSPNP